MRYQTVFDMQFGVKRQADSSMVNVSCAQAAPMFHGIPIRFSEHCVERKHKVKRWNRLNRPSKVRHRYTERPCAYKLEPPMVDQTTVLCHPDFEKQLEKMRLN
ncbi:hypothetical protein LCGC14_0362560 [marine sediment metagenome]|uniref:Uncharacterized protein n=1 Tax=marine sediment metagenome TaxID=412755 RepID=A0A0F9WG41_9ZZZZ